MSKKTRKPARTPAPASQKSSRTAAPAGKKPANRLWLIGGLVLIAVLALAGVWLSQQNNTGGAAALAALPKEISVAQAFEKRQSGAFVLDVRQPEEWAEYHVPGSTLIPLGELESRLSELPRDQEIVVVCRSGNRSQEGRDILLNAGFSQVTSMAGGLIEWQASGNETVTGP